MELANRIAGAAAIGAAMLLPISGAKADVVYTYIGNDFTVFTSPYNGTDSVTATITLASPLGNSLELGGVTPVNYTISDGVQTITEATNTSTLAQIFDLGTDSTGNIIQWEIVVIADDIGYDFITTRYEGMLLQLDTAQISDAQGASTRNDPGTWSAARTTVPEPSTWAMLLLGFAGLGLAAYRRSRACLLVA